MRTSSIQKIFCADGSVVNGKLGKLMRKNDYNGQIIWLIKLHYNGQLYLVPENMLIQPTKLEKKNDPKNDTYWRNQYESSQTSLQRMRFVQYPQSSS